ncbi:hypothetical protein ABMA58_16745 [Oceanospirillum sp. HFRX-1_2]
MNPEMQVLQFANLLEIANLSAEDGDGYAKQEKLIKTFRDEKKPFVAKMPMRHRFRCEPCKVEQGESIYHFENPAIPASKEEKDIMWGPAVGIWAQVDTRELHGFLAHGNEPSLRLKQVLASVSY